ncbi:hypothetical protein HJFPF1_06118 [Paramyrothecium foliicola]|nr:hypothetical protein HJFPF1_06118 [Paramyrothecium foliicola]
MIVHFGFDKAGRLCSWAFGEIQTLNGRPNDVRAHGGPRPKYHPTTLGCVGVAAQLSVVGFRKGSVESRLSTGCQEEEYHRPSVAGPLTGQSTLVVTLVSRRAMPPTGATKEPRLT